MQRLRWRRACVGRWRPPLKKKLKNFAIIFGFFPHFYFAECKSLPSAVVALDKAAFTGRGFDGGSLPSVALGKRFVECKATFVECNRHSAKSPPPIVISVSSILPIRSLGYQTLARWILLDSFLGSSYLHASKPPSSCMPRIRRPLPPPS